jgi:hypothetical protein
VFVGARLRGLLDGAENSKRLLIVGFVLPEEELVLLELPPPPPLPQPHKLARSNANNR